MSKWSLSRLETHVCTCSRLNQFFVLLRKVNCVLGSFLYWGFQARSPTKKQRPSSEVQVQRRFWKRWKSLCWLNSAFSPQWLHLRTWKSFGILCWALWMKFVFRLLFKTRLTICLAFTPNLCEFQSCITDISQIPKKYLLFMRFWGNIEGNT